MKPTVSAMRATLTRTRLRLYRFERLRRSGFFSVSVRALLGAPATARRDPAAPARGRALAFADDVPAVDAGRFVARASVAAFGVDERRADALDRVEVPRARVLLAETVARRRTGGRLWRFVSVFACVDRPGVVSVTASAASGLVSAATSPATA
jgi:hypothetical protein